MRLFAVGLMAAALGLAAQVTPNGESVTPLVVFSSNGKDVSDVLITKASDFSSIQFSSGAVYDTQRSIVARAWTGENGITVRLELERGLWGSDKNGAYRSPIGEFTLSPASPVFVSKDELYGLPAMTMRVVELTGRCEADPGVIKNLTESLAIVGVIDAEQGAGCDFVLENRTDKRLTGYVFRKRGEWSSQLSSGGGGSALGKKRFKISAVVSRKPGQPLTDEDLRGWELAVVRFADGTTEGDAEAIRSIKGLP